MTEKEIADMLKSTKLPVAYYQFPVGEAPQLPYLVYFYSESDNFSADNGVYQRVDQLNVELYTENKDFATEKAIEAVLDANGFFWEKYEAFIDSEQMFQIAYEMETIINGEQS